MRFGPFEISIHNHGFFRLDGGSMFGAVPKNLWAKRIPVDEENCIKLATRSLVIRDGKRKVLVDVGNGDKFGEKERRIFAIENVPESELGFKQSEITDIILTHLHFDHGGGISYYEAGGKLALTYPEARVFLQRSNFENAMHPNIRERASYLKENVEILRQAKLTLLDGETEVYPGIWVHPVNGHTRGLQYVELRTDSGVLLYPADLMPTSRHVALPYHMGYDICTETLLKEKAEFLRYAVEKDAIIVFEHDPDTAAARIIKNERGDYALGASVEL